MAKDATWGDLPTGYKALLGCAAVFVLIYSNGGDAERPAAERRVVNCATHDDAAGAYVMAKDLVTRQLKAPSTADFPWSYSDRVTRLGGCKYAVVGYVDAQNGFGAMIRTTFLADVEYRPSSDTWTGTAALFE